VFAFAKRQTEKKAKHNKNQLNHKRTYRIVLVHVYVLDLKNRQNKEEKIYASEKQKNTCFSYVNNARSDSLAEKTCQYNFMITPYSIRRCYYQADGSPAASDAVARRATEHIGMHLTVFK
jgi:hypothetical protein